MSSKVLLQQLDVMVEAPNGVENLRDLILELAVRGKLVSQDSSDEPASVLLTKITQLTERNAALGRRTSPSPLAEPEDSKPFEIPLTWAWTRLEEIGIISPRNDLLDDLVVGFCPMALLPEAYGGTVGHEERRWRDVKRGYTHFVDGDVVMAKITPCFQNGKAAVMRGLPGGAGAGTTELHVFRPVDGTVVPEYILVFLKSPRFVAGGVQTMTGTAGQQRVSREYFARAPLPLPPLAEQRRIATKVSELMARCDELEGRQQRCAEARARLNRSALHHLTAADDDASLVAHWQRLSENFGLLYDTPEAVAELRQTILQLAVRGKLAPQQPAEEPASVLIARIAAERGRLIQSGRMGKLRALEPVSPGDRTFAAPAGWAWVRIGDIATVVGGIQKSPKRTPKNNHFPYLRVANVQRGALVLDQIHRFELGDGELEQWRLEVGDLLVVEGNGSEDEIGRCARWGGEIEDCVHQNHLIRVRPVLPDMSHFILRYLNSPDGIGAMKRLAVTTSGLYNLSVGKITSIPVPLPPRTEQTRIVAACDQLVALCDQLEAALTESRARAAHLAASILHHLTAA